MKNNITKDIEYMKYVLGYKRGVVISEQPIKKTSLSEQSNDKKPSIGCIDGNCDSGEGTYKYSNGAEYAGQWEGGKRNGKGTNKYSSGAVYTGEWKEDKQDGPGGTFTSSKGTVYTGEFKDNRLLNGQVIYKLSNGNSRYGEWTNGEQGELKDGKPPEQVQSTSGDGISPEKNNNEKSSSGCISGDCEDGQGTFRYTDKDEYTGQWKDGKRNGQGTDTTLGDDNSIVYVETGEWKDNSLFNGYITYIFDDGTGVYYEFINGKQGDRKNGKPPVLNKTPVLNNNQEQSKTGDEVKDGAQDELKNGEPPKQDNATIDPNNATVQNNPEDCKEPTAPTHRYKNDKNYQYAKSGDCWWAKNITNNKWFNLTELVKTKPKVQSSIDKLNNGTDLIKL